MKTFMSVTLTNFGMNSELNEGRIYLHLPSGAKLAHKVSYEDGLKAMAQLSKQLNQVPIFTINYYNPAISYRELYGFLD